jgi:hypothetical protein
MSSGRRMPDEWRSMRRRLELLPGAPWKAMVEGRDHLSGDSFIMVGSGDSRGDDIYVTFGAKPAPAEILDFIAEARNKLPAFLDDLERLSGLTPDSDLE